MILFWILALEIIGLAALPITCRFFRSYSDRGYLLSKAVGLALACYINWLCCSMGILRFGVASSIASVVLLALLSWFWGTHDFEELKHFLMRVSPATRGVVRQSPAAQAREDSRTTQQTCAQKCVISQRNDLISQTRLVLGSELVFVFSFAVMAIIRACNPDISGAEKLPDCAFLSGILESKHFPPADPWYAGKTINYYYYGLYLTAFVAKLTRTPLEYAFNLGIAMLFALTFQGAMGVCFGLTKKWGYGLLGGLLVAVAGNMDAALQVVLRLREAALGGVSFYPFDWFNWWQSSRVIVREGIDITINEFPFWSYILGDLHAHVSVLPFSLLMLAMALELIRTPWTADSATRQRGSVAFRMFLVSVVLGAIPATNIWDTPTSCLIVFAALVCGCRFSREIPTGSFFQFLIGAIRAAKGNGAWACASIAFFSYLLYLPFHLNFRALAGTDGIGLVDAAQRTLFSDFATVHGVFLFCLVSLLAGLLAGGFRAASARSKVLLVICLAGLAVISMAVFGSVAIAACMLLLVFVLMVPFSLGEDDCREKVFVLLLTVIALALLLGCEFFYVDDPYGETLERQNTVFKFYYQAWVLFGIVSVFAVRRLCGIMGSRLRYAWLTAFWGLLACALAFAVFGTTVKCDYFQALRQNDFRSGKLLDGISYLSRIRPGDAAAVQYLRKHGRPGQVLVEAVGPAYSDCGRLSAYTGLSAILGWANHENLWRSGAWPEICGRSDEVAEVYLTHDIDKATAILDKHKVDYVFVGRLEKEQYPEGDFRKFEMVLREAQSTLEPDGTRSVLYRYEANKGGG